MTCKDCPNRTVGCHIDCEIYKADTAANEAVKAMHRQEKLKNKVYYEHTERAKRSYERDAKRRRGY